ncbi:MAG: ABC transporter ATP-binding protein [Erysipelotrichaceae bacterium]|nr:ABC transporter ATP-binding protein [Erysipelotrichaceae bacterium]MBQ4252449.1 ABC transporter ATP-binding protein [Erysipelotrichaceae bacterium]
MLLQVNNLHTYYGNIKALRGASFHIDEGEIVAFIGANGAGKSTLMNTLAGTLKPREGSIIFRGEDITRTAPKDRVERGIVLCPEGRQIFPKFTVEENLLMGAYSVRDKQAISTSYARVFELFPQIKDRQKQLAGTLSGGEQQMLAIGRALMAQPKILMLDEPSLGLSPILVEEIFALIEEINRNGTTILLVEQNAMAALEIANRAYALETGEVTISGTGAELLHNDQIIKAYLGG